MPGASCTRSLAGRKKGRTSVVKSPRSHRLLPALPAQWLYGLYAFSPVTGLCCHRRLADMAGPRPVGPTSPPQDLTPASGCQDHAISPYAAARLRQRLRRGKPRLFQKTSPGLSAVRQLAADDSRASSPALPSRVVPDAAASTASQPAFVTFAKHPFSGRDGRHIGTIFNSEKKNIFSERARQGKSG